MKYDRDWVNRVNKTKEVIPAVRQLIERIPHPPDRSLIKQRFEVAVNDYGYHLSLGLDSSRDEALIYELGVLAADMAET